MNISHYSAFFHDGSIISIQHTDDELAIAMESAEVSSDDLEENITLSKENALKGILHLKAIKTICIQQKPYLGKLQMEGNSATILDLEISEGAIRLFVEWVNYPPAPKLENMFCEIIIEAEKIYWEIFRTYMILLEGIHEKIDCFVAYIQNSF